jgi:type I restriction enzyme R subunit
MLYSLEPDQQVGGFAARLGLAATPAQEKAAIDGLVDAACRPFDNPATRTLLKDIKQKTDIVIDEITTDQVTSAGFDKKKAEQTVTSFKAFIEQNRDELTALQILYNQPQGRQRLTYSAIRDLVQHLSDPPHYLTTANVWQAYRRLDAARVRGAPVDEQLTEVVSLVRFALGQTEALEPFAAVVEQRFNLWMGREKRAGREYTVEQLEWLRVIASFIAANAEIAPRDFQEAPSLADRGGILQARKVLGAGLNDMLNDLQDALVA